MAVTGSPGLAAHASAGVLGPAATGRVVFSVDGHEYVWDDVVAFARHRAIWPSLEREVREGMACLRYAMEAGEALPPTAVEAAAKEFRYERRLITAEEAEDWLAARRIDVGTWMAFIRRSLLQRLHASDLASITGRHPVAEEEVDPLLWPTGVCTGFLGSVASQLAGRVAVHAALRGPVPSTLESLDASFACFRAEVLTPAVAQDALAANHLRWIRVVRDELRFDREGAAAEALLCLREDGLGMDEVARLADAELRRYDTYLEDVEAALWPLLVGAAEGDVLGPVPRGDGASVVRVVTKVLPSLEDADVRRRVEDAVISSAIQREVDERVRWHERF